MSMAEKRKWIAERDELKRRVAALEAENAELRAKNKRSTDARNKKRDTSSGTKV